MKILMRRTAVGSIGHFMAGKTYDVDEATATLLAEADACDLVDAPARAPEPAEAATDDGAETAETAEAVKPKRKPRARRPRKKPAE